MDVERMHNVLEKLAELVETESEDLSNVDVCELCQAIDMIKDLSEAIYYRTLTECTKEKTDTTARMTLKNG